ncbi:serine/threonine-protein kinase [Sphaerisporangium aureirubrum]|uniref:Protein kinase n=1 Tax=Sphaerisporangium aureirubrum TaxID=1544736 RepID=A0ABW1NLG4_9ACTN
MRVTLVQGDITEQQVDAVVNANSSPWWRWGGSKRTFIHTCGYQPTFPRILVVATEGDQLRNSAGPTHARHPLIDALSFVWAVVPLISFGLLNSVVFGFAAYRTRSRVMAIAAGCYLAVLAAFVSTAGIRDFGPDDWQNQAALWAWILGPMLGGTLHALIVRKHVFPPKFILLSQNSRPASASGSWSWDPWGGSEPVHSPGEQRPNVAGPTGLAVPLSYIWALVPLLTLGFATCVVIGSAAIRLRSRNLGLAAVGYLILLAVFVVVNAPLDRLPNTDWRAQVYFWTWSLGPWWGGTFHAFVLRQAVFRRRFPIRSGRANPEMSNAPTPTQPIRVLGPYKLIDRIGGGGQGVVYLGLTPSGRRVAVKVLHTRMGTGTAEREGFLREVTAAQRVPPFATVPIIDKGIVGDVAYIVSEYIDGPSLETYIRSGRRMDGDGITRLAISTAAALRGIHSTNIVHRDFKPANVLLAPDGPRVIDFGIAKALDNVTTTIGGVKGTPAYMSPEQVSGHPVGHPSDIFSWASTIYFAATGRPAFDGPTIYAVSHQILSRHPDVSVLPQPLRHAVAASFSKDSRTRPTAAQLMLAITQ